MPSAVARKDRPFRLVSNDTSPSDRVPAIDAPEVPLCVSFEGITEAEARMALAAFPGGRRFVLVTAH